MPIEKKKKAVDIDIWNILTWSMFALNKEMAWRPLTGPSEWHDPLTRYWLLTPQKWSSEDRTCACSPFGLYRYIPSFAGTRRKGQLMGLEFNAPDFCEPRLCASAYTSWNWGGGGNMSARAARFASAQLSFQPKLSVPKSSRPLVSSSSQFLQV